MNLIKHISILSLLFIITGCVATTSSTLKYAKENYKTIDEVVISIGPPQSKYTLDNGDFMYKWVYSGSINMPSTTVYNGSATAYNNGYSSTAYGSGTSTTFGGGMSSRVCEMSILTTNSNIIKMIKFNQDTMGTQPLTASMCAQMFRIN